jgi:hypothetical protein
MSASQMTHYCATCGYLSVTLWKNSKSTDSIIRIINKDLLFGALDFLSIYWDSDTISCDVHGLAPCFINATKVAPQELLQGCFGLHTGRVSQSMRTLPISKAGNASGGNNRAVTNHCGSMHHAPLVGVVGQNPMHCAAVVPHDDVAL